jgi:uncharacterized membrane protein (UPF0127 family)
MFRTASRPATGMLFLPEVSEHTFWMKNTLVLPST